MGLLKSSKPHTAITDVIDRCVRSRDISLEVELANLVDLIRNSGTSDGERSYGYEQNQSEAARCLRKKLKYGSTLAQSRTLELLDLFVVQGVRFKVLYNDAKLLERLDDVASGQGNANGAAAVTGGEYDPRVVRKARTSMHRWVKVLSERDVHHSATFAPLYQLARRHERSNRRGSSSTALLEDPFANTSFTNDLADESAVPEATGSSGRGRYADQIYKIDMKREGPRIRALISDATAASTSLRNALASLPSNTAANSDPELQSLFLRARVVRKKVLRYLQLVTGGEHLGSLVEANDRLVEALTAYDHASERPDNSVQCDEEATDDFSEAYSNSSYEEDNDDASSNPFGDSHAL